MSFFKLQKYYNSGCEHCPALKLLYIIADPITQLLINFKRTPMHVTHLSVFFALLSIPLFFYQMPWAYAVCLFFSILFDVADGMVARATNQGSTLGAFYDHFTDKLKIFALFLICGMTYNNQLIWILSITNVSFFYIMSILNITNPNEKKLNDKTCNTIEIKPNNKRGFLFKAARSVYRSTFMIYANFMLYFIPMAFNQTLAIIFQAITLIIISKALIEQFNVQLRNAKNGVYYL